MQVRELEGMAVTSEQKAAIATANRREQAMYERRKGEIQDSIEQVRMTIRCPFVLSIAVTLCWARMLLS